MTDYQEEIDKLVEQYPGLGSLLLNDMSEDAYGVSIHRIAAMLVTLQQCKDEQYGASWAKNGEFGMLLNVKRKEDRLDHLCILTAMGEDSDTHAVALADTLADRSTYGMMWLSNLSKYRPEAFKQWLKEEWCTATRIPYESMIQLLGLEE